MPRRPSDGYLVVTDPDGVQEFDTVRCRHCQRIVPVKPGTWGQVYLMVNQHGQYQEAAGAYCASCSGPLCLPCERRGGCVQSSQHWERSP